jgi:hypothetical protein
MLLTVCLLIFGSTQHPAACARTSAPARTRSVPGIQRFQRFTYRAAATPGSEPETPPKPQHITPNVPNPRRGGVAGNYGTQGVPASTNQPASRGSAVAWTDATGNFWFFGGYDGNTLDDLWEYTP